MSRAYQRVMVHWRIFVVSLIAVFAVHQLIYPDEFGRFLDMALLAIFVMLIASQFFWVRQVLGVVEGFLPGKPRRSWLAVVAFLIYLFFFIYSYPSIESTNNHVFRATDPRLSSVLIVAIFWWWLVASWAGFGLVMVFLDRRSCDALGSVGLPQSAPGCGRSLRHSRSWHEHS